MDRLTATVGAGVQGPHIPSPSADASVRRDERGALRSGRWTPRPRSAPEQLQDGTPVTASAPGPELALIRVVHPPRHRSARCFRPRRSWRSRRCAFVCGRVVVPGVVRDGHRLASSAGGTSGSSGWKRVQPAIGGVS